MLFIIFTLYSFNKSSVSVFQWVETCDFVVDFLIFTISRSGIKLWIIIWGTHKLYHIPSVLTHLPVTYLARQAIHNSLQLLYACPKYILTSIIVLLERLWSNTLLCQLFSTKINCVFSWKLIIFMEFHDTDMKVKINKPVLDTKSAPALLIVINLFSNSKMADLPICTQQFLLSFSWRFFILFSFEIWRKLSFLYNKTLRAYLQLVKAIFWNFCIFLLIFSKRKTPMWFSTFSKIKIYIGWISW